jgi:hypothetical protein
MSFEEDTVRWQRASTRIMNLRKSNDDGLFTNINVILDDMNSLDFALQVVTSNEVCFAYK